MSAPTLQTARLCLRPAGIADLDHFQSSWNDPEVGRFLWDGAPISRATAAAVLAASEASFAASGFGLWALTLASEDEIVGFCGLRQVGQEGEIELLYAVSPVYWGCGLSTEAARAVLRHAFETLGLARIVAAANPANVASWRVLEKVGMQRVRRRVSRGEELFDYVLHSQTYLRAG